MITVRDSLVLSFGIAGDRRRTLRLPDPVGNADAADVINAASRLIMADVFEVQLQSLEGAVLERVETRVLV